MLGASSFTRLERVILVINFPSELRAGLDIYLDERLNRKRRAYGPQRHSRKRPVSRDADACSQAPILDAEIIVLRIRAKSLDVQKNAIFSRRGLCESNLVVPDLGQAVHLGSGGADLERNGDREIRAGRLAVEVEEIVIIDAGLDGALSSIAQTMVDHHLTFPAGQRHGLAVFIRVT